MFAIRPATQADAAAIAHVHVMSWRTTYAGLVSGEYLLSLDEAERAEQWRHWLTLDVDVFAADLDGQIVGFAAGGRLREPLEGYDAELYTLYLLAEAQRQGVGKRLLQALAEKLIARGFGSMLAWVLDGNSSRGFYERTGAVMLVTKEIGIGGTRLPVTAFGWRNLQALSLHSAQLR